MILVHFQPRSHSHPTGLWVFAAPLPLGIEAGGVCVCWRASSVGERTRTRNCKKSWPTSLFELSRKSFGLDMDVRAVCVSAVCARPLSIFHDQRHQKTGFVRGEDEACIWLRGEERWAIGSGRRRVFLLFGCSLCLAMLSGRSVCLYGGYGRSFIPKEDARTHVSARVVTHSLHLFWPSR